MAGESRAAWRHWSVIAGLVVACALRLAWILRVDSQPTHDALWYVSQAQNIAAGAGYHVDGQPTAYWPVGYAAALGAVFKISGGALLAGRIANVAFSLVSVFLVHELTALVTGSLLAGRIALWMLALYPTDIQYGSLLVSEPMFSMLVLAASVLVLRPARSSRQLMVAGMLFGLATLTRVQGLALPLLIAGFREVSSLRGLWPVVRERLHEITRLYAGLFLTLSPWVLRNFVAFGAFVLVSTNGGINFYIGNHPEATGAYTFGDATRARLYDGSIPERRGGENELLVSKRAAELAWDYVLSHPGETVARWPAKLSALYARDNTGITWNKVDKPLARELRSLLPITELYYRVLWGLAVCGLVLGCWPRMRVRSPWLPVLVVLSFTLLHVAFFGSSRFHAPMMPWVIVYAASAMAAPWIARARVHA